ncbi:MAG: DJ-1/PfpI family protein [Muribaculaceae bacterium]|nr:DJ-1/PfpI family protein [Muribaculaceae bacterium]MDE6643768.1 DJ-1/PfpI family protein [Muribaculaceae bacterium]MDE7092592.1 DJ-1/PfpI family protein [Muribaculaceae bacterium]
MNRSFLFLANGFEEIEALTVVDVMRRAGMNVNTVSINKDKKVTGAHGIVVEADTLFADNDYANCEWLICPGGMPGATHLHEYKPLAELLTKHNDNGGKIAAICAAPAVVLAPLGILDGKEATCYPGFEDKMGKALHIGVQVAALDTIITANGPASASKFALAIVANSMGDGIAREVANGMLIS